MVEVWMLDSCSIHFSNMDYSIIKLIILSMNLLLSFISIISGMSNTLIATGPVLEYFKSPSTQSSD